MGNAKTSPQSSETGAAIDVADARESDVRLPSGMTHGELRTFLGQEDTGKYIRRVIGARVHKGTPWFVIEIAQEAICSARRPHGSRLGVRREAIDDVDPVHH